MSLGYYINSTTDNALDAVGTAAVTNKEQTVVEKLWLSTFVAYPPEMVIKMPYFFANNYTVAPGVFGTSQQFKVNSLWDPDLTGVGHQPLGRDTWTSIYDYYKVLKCKVEVVQSSNFYQTGITAGADAAAGTNFAPTFIGGVMDITANPPNSLTVWKEARAVTANSQERFSPIQRMFHVGSRGDAVISYEMDWTPDMFDTGVLNTATENVWTPVGADPADLNYFTTIAYNSASGVTIGYNLEVRLTMLVAFKNVNRTLTHQTN